MGETIRPSLGLALLCGGAVVRGALVPGEVDRGPGVAGGHEVGVLARARVDRSWGRTAVHWQFWWTRQNPAHF